MIMLGAAGATFSAFVTTGRADVTALAFVSGIYSAYKGKNAKGIALDSDAVLRRYFEPSLAAQLDQRPRNLRRDTSDVRWPEADIREQPIRVRFRG
jgi:hypothetical protein